MDKEDNRLTERIVVLVTPEFKARYTAQIEGDRSQHIRPLLEADLAALEAVGSK